MEQQDTFKRIYVIVARNVTVGRYPTPSKKVCVTSASIAVQGGHALLQLAAKDRNVSQTLDLLESNLIFLSVSDAAELEPLDSLLNMNSIDHVVYCDPDDPWQGSRTAIATVPISREEAKVLSFLKPWGCACNIKR